MFFMSCVNLCYIKKVIKNFSDTSVILNDFVFTNHLSSFMINLGQKIFHKRYNWKGNQNSLLKTHFSENIRFSVYNGIENKLLSEMC